MEKYENNQNSDEKELNLDNLMEEMSTSSPSPQKKSGRKGLLSSFISTNENNSEELSEEISSHHEENSIESVEGEGFVSPKRKRGLLSQISSQEEFEEDFKEKENIESESKETLQEESNFGEEFIESDLSRDNTDKEEFIDNRSSHKRKRGLLGLLGSTEQPEEEKEFGNKREKEMSREEESGPLLSSFNRGNHQEQGERQERGFDYNYSEGNDLSYENGIIDKDSSILDSRFKNVDNIEEGDNSEDEVDLAQLPANVVEEDSEDKSFKDPVLSQFKQKKEEVIEQEESSDLFDSMLGDIVDEEGIEDEDVKVPIEKPGMDSVIVTQDGRSLAEMLPGMRSGNRKTADVLRDIKEKKRVEEVNGQKFSDDRYTKHAKKIKKETEENEKRASLSLKFLQRNSSMTEQEKIILKNLGLNSNQLVNLMKSKELTAKEKRELLGLGRYGAEKYFKGRRYKTTVGDSAIIEFLAKFKFANTRILRWLKHEGQNRTWRKLDRLRNIGLVESKTIIGLGDLFADTEAGVAVAGYSLSPGLRPIPKANTISSTMGVNYLAACLWFNTINVLNSDDFPAENRVIPVQSDGRDRVRGEMLVSELEIRSSLGKEINPQSTTMQTLGDERLYDVISSNVREEFERWDFNGKVGESPEFSLGNEYMWVLYPQGSLTLSYHVPDLVVKRDRGPNGEPNSIAVELERYDKSRASDKYEKVMLAYKLDEHLYKEVVWVTPNSRTARALVKAAEEVGFTRYRIIPIITEDGVYNKPDIWMI